MLALWQTLVKDCVKRIGEKILKEGAVLKRVENLGEKDLPFKMYKAGKVFKKAHYFTYQFESHPSILSKLQESCVRDLDIMRSSPVEIHPLPRYTGECTLEEELKPPVDRPNVKAIISGQGEIRKSFYGIGTVH
ncbi:MRPS6 [Cordylochernes scorpioides]|uniref:Small ribosomal subunit protein bS6m n=1 Tax=Cordylochernes scorpioides TaxID=51811 RepID=A0ABY6K5M1_9ARAC|nr:MRPS6 [Cordylochernes scorpioides]